MTLQPKANILNSRTTNCLEFKFQSVSKKLVAKWFRSGASGVIFTVGDESDLKGRRVAQSVERRNIEVDDVDSKATMGTWW